jgi:uncharacterized protein (DUF2225 family)
MSLDIDVDHEAISVIRAAWAYRKAEQEETPRLWRGARLQNLATILDEALAAYVEKYGTDTFEGL